MCHRLYLFVGDRASAGQFPLYVVYERLVISVGDRVEVGEYPKLHLGGSIFGECNGKDMPKSLVALDDQPQNKLHSQIICLAAPRRCFQYEHSCF